ncbi:MAG: hypothetical protein LBF59_02630, partial [Prevotellaceae bacterium]|nr:hypothetical protein [Prevotellaceae bacterium]
MKTFIKHLKRITVGLILPAIFSCSNDFLREDNMSLLLTPEGTYNTISISPEWGSGDYPLYSREAGNAKFSIPDVPHWLNISSTTGQFVNGTAYITCSASVCDEFAEVGVYSVTLIIDIEGVGKYVFPLYYITEGTPDISATETLELDILNFDYGKSLNVANKGEGILVWNIIDFPEWITVNPYSSSGILFPYETTSVNITYNEDFISLEDISLDKIKDKYTGKIIIASNDKKKPQTVTDVILNIGSPSARYYTDMIDFERTETVLSFYTENFGDGILIWQIEDYPEWITLSQTHGFLTSYGNIEIRVTCDRSKLPAGASSGEITIRTNDPQNPVHRITVKCRNGNGNSDNVFPINGTVTDAQFDKNADILYLATSQPNRLLAYDVKTKSTAYETDLPNAPTCFSISFDRGKIVVGHEGKISVIDMTSQKVEKVMEVENIVYDVEWGADNWCCYTPGTTVDHCNLKWINTVSGELDESGNSYLYGGSIIRKIPGQDYIIASQLYLSPSGITVFDSQTREYVNYFHKSIDNFWLSADGTYLFDSYNNVYKTSAFPSQTEVSPVAQLKTEQYVYAKWIDHNPATGNLWVLRNNYYYDNNFKVWQVETNDYTVVKTLFYDEYYQTTIDGEYKEYP